MAKIPTSKSKRVALRPKRVAIATRRSTQIPKVPTADATIAMTVKKLEESPLELRAYLSALSKKEVVQAAGYSNISVFCKNNQGLRRKSLTGRKPRGRKTDKIKVSGKSPSKNQIISEMV